MAQKSISRVYRSELRQQQAAQTRSKVVAAAAELFATLGYAGTTFAKIAAAAGVSAQTVQAHGPKAALLKAAAEYVTLGEPDKDDVFDLELGQRLLAAGDRDEAFSSMISVLSDMYGRGASLWLALAGAATMDPELGRYHADGWPTSPFSTGDYSLCAATADGYGMTSRSTTSWRRQRS